MRFSDEEMANILFASNLATEENLRGLWHQITPEKDIGRVLVENNLLHPQTYKDLLVHMESIHKNDTPQEPEELQNQEATVETIDLQEETHKPPMVGGEEEISIIQTNSPNEMGRGRDLFEDNSGLIEKNLDEKPHVPVVEESDLFIEEILPFEESSSRAEPSRSEANDNQEIDIFGGESVIEHNSPEYVPPSERGESQLDIESSPLPKEEPAIPIIEPTQSTPSASPVPQQREPEKTNPSDNPDSLLTEVEEKNDELPADFLESSGFGQLAEPIPEQITSTSTLHEMLLFARKVNASDVHLVPKSAVTLRVYGEMKQGTAEPLTAEHIEKIISETFPAEKIEEFRLKGDIEFVYTIEGAGRYRTTIMKYRHGWTLTARVIAMQSMDYKTLGLPESCMNLTKWAQGMVLVTGPAGCGKTTTLSTLVEMINHTRNEHIITIEDPIEMIFSKGKSQITQRQIGRHTLSQENALRGALRQDPDILVISELRDIESIKLAVSAAETGHLVFGTMNTTNATRTISRLIDSFPPEEQGIIRSMVSESLRGIICQQLIPKKDKSGVIPAFEVLMVTAPVSNMIRKDETHQLANTMITGKADGMVILDESLRQLVEADQISAEEAYRRAEDKNKFKHLIKE